jgi:hypothetical protein
MRGSSVVEGMLLDWVRPRPTPEPRLPVSRLSAEEKAHVTGVSPPGLLGADAGCPSS